MYMAMALRYYTIFLSVVIVIFASVIHELAHAYTAYRLGDDTAKREGRLTLNPLKHLDPVGSLALPVLMGIMGGPVFAYAKPVPYNPFKLRNPKRDEVLVALAGPVSNLILALVGGAIFRVILSAFGSPASYDAVFWVLTSISTFVYVNLVLLFFNLIPIPPLDGSKVVLYFLGDEQRQSYYQLQRYAMVILIIALYLIPQILHLDPVGMYLNVTAGNLADLILGI